MVEIHRTGTCSEWLRGLRDKRARERINNRISRIEGGLFGDVKYFSGIGEVRIDYGPGYRLYLRGGRCRGHPFMWWG
jgi:putative addiction module killer protein